MGQSKTQNHTGKSEGKGPELQTPCHLLQLSRASNKYPNNLRSQAALFPKTGAAEQWGTIESWVCPSGVLKSVRVRTSRAAQLHHTGPEVD